MYVREFVDVFMNARTPFEIAPRDYAAHVRDDDDGETTTRLTTHTHRREHDEAFANAEEKEMEGETAGGYMAPLPRVTQPPSVFSALCIHGTHI